MADYDMALEKVRQNLGLLETVVDVVQIREARDGVIERYQPLFKNAHKEPIPEVELRGFLRFENNKHWSGLHRQEKSLFSDFLLLQKAVGLLANEDLPVDKRLDDAISQVVGMGKALATAILHIIGPDQYGVWNSTSEAGLKSVDLWPKFERGASLGARYVKINAILQRMAKDLNLDLWTLDVFWWALVMNKDSDPSNGTVNLDETDKDSTASFGLEKHLHAFLRDNWNSTELGKDWEIYSEDGEPDLGFEYPCGVGFVDILAKHKSSGDWLVIELKRGQTADATVGQVLRYMGWVRNEMAAEDEDVSGLIIAASGDDKIRYALSMIPNVELKLYSVDFRLKDGEPL